MEQKTFEKMKSIWEKDKGTLSFLIDPPDQEPEQAGKMAKVAEENGADFINIGGSVGAQGVLLDETIKQIKENCNLPAVIFPGGVGTVSEYADAVYFMSLINSRNPYWIAHAQITVAPHIRRLGVEPIPSTYIVIEPGGAVGWVGDANLMPRSRPYLTAMAALAGQYFGSQLIIMDGGSGAALPPPNDIIKLTSQTIDLPISFGGGCKTPQQAYEAIKAGAVDIRIGTVFEGNTDLKDVGNKVSAFAKAIKKAGQEK
ncbi:MAG: geranylgeranylglyceryl/heptaprenylglyceryl phosphate synthase [Candidatus Diapherotrites archaeon]|nr:geranylgeranylglyceryl/heptaprenylglyceryl phosphate synthase [Candidatus Diapherotrites archaeon]